MKPYSGRYEVARFHYEFAKIMTFTSKNNYAKNIYCSSISVIIKKHKYYFGMSEQELNSYRFTSGEDPSDEMLECIMKDALEYAMSRRRKAEERMKAEVERQRQLHREKWANRLNSCSNG